MINMEGFMPFFGVVEDVNDPEQIGRVRVRVYGHHTRNKGKLAVENLPWMSCVISNSSGVSGIGATPHSYVTGSTVFGFFIDDDHNTGIVMGSIMGKPNATDSEQGFSDPEGKYPFYEDGESDVNRLARDASEHNVTKKKDEKKITSVSQSSGGSWSEPPYVNNSVYPNNKVVETPSGHVFEVDDTEGNERIHTQHTTGTYEEMQASGDRVVKVVGDGYEIIAGDGYAYVKGSLNLTIDQTCNTYIRGDWNVKVDGNVNEEIKGNYNRRTSGSVNDDASGQMKFSASRINLN